MEYRVRERHRVHYPHIRANVYTRCHRNPIKNPKQPQIKTLGARPHVVVIVAGDEHCAAHSTFASCPAPASQPSSSSFCWFISCVRFAVFFISNAFCSRSMRRVVSGLTVSLSHCLSLSLCLPVCMMFFCMIINGISVRLRPK